MDAAKRICGTKSQPWSLEAPSGQKILIKLIDFSAYSWQDSGHRPQSCRNSGVVVDKTDNRNESICVGGTEREKQLLLSSGKVVDIFFTQSDQHISEAIRFLLEVKGINKFHFYSATMVAATFSDIL